MRYVFRKKLNYPYDNPLIQSEAKGTHAITPERMGAPYDWTIIQRTSAVCSNCGCGSTIQPRSAGDYISATEQILRGLES